MSRHFEFTIQKINELPAPRWWFCNDASQSNWHVAAQQGGNFAQVICKLGLTLCCGALLLFASCGASSSSGAVPPSNTSTGTQTQGPIIIATDHAVYQGNEQIHVTIHNTLSRAIYAFDTRASCSILDLEVYTSGTWRQEASTARCSLGRPAQLVTIPPGGRYNATIRADQPGINRDVFPSGSYRLVLNYTEDAKADASSKTTSLPSAALTIHSSGGPPSTPSTSSGTPVKVNPPSTPTP